MARVDKAVHRADITYDLDSFQSGVPLVPLYVSNGIVGGCFDHFGFQSNPNTGTPEGRTALGYIDHYHRADHGRHIQFPLAIVQAAFADRTPLNLVDCAGYRQTLDLYNGVLTTVYDLYGPTEITAFASQSAPNLFVMRIDRSPIADDKQLAIAFEYETSVCQNIDMRWKVTPVQVAAAIEGDRVRVRSVTNTTETEWVVHCPEARFAIDGTRLVLRLAAGVHELRVWVKHDGGVDEAAVEWLYDSLLSQHRAVWHGLWRSSWVDLPEHRAQAIWCRTKYLTLSHFPALAARPLCPTGLAGNIWGFTFPQDVYYVAENLPRLGHIDRAELALRFWRTHLPDVKRYGKRLLGTDGAYYPWTPPYKDFDAYETDGVCGADSYELHNPAYVAAMVWHAWLVTANQTLLRRYFPVIEEVFRFYRCISTAGDAGTYDTYHEKARGQDEASSTEGRLRNLLCVSYSAEYTARMYVDACATLGKARTPLLDDAEKIAAAGYTRRPLLRAEGYYRTYEGDHRPPGEQKHPVQLNPIAYLPMPHMVDSDPAVETAWRHRYELTKDARKPLTLGWTIGEFALASARMRSPADMEQDLRAIQPCHGADARWIQFYESSFWEGWHRPKSYYLPMMGLYLQAFTDCLVQDWRGYVDLFACLLPGWETQRLSFSGIRVRGGIVVSGRFAKGSFTVRLKPRKAQSVKVRVSLPGARIEVRNSETGPSVFDGGQVVELASCSRKAIELRGSGA